MSQVGFSAEKYIEEQSRYILERIGEGAGQRLYLEFGGKLVQDKHAMRVLPGFDENAKIKLLHKMKDQVEIIICIYSGDITTNKTRQDFEMCIRDSSYGCCGLHGLRFRQQAVCKLDISSPDGADKYEDEPFG